MASYTKTNIYSLSDPLTSEVVYIGKTVRSLNKRLISHKSELFNTKKKQWMQELSAVGLEPKIELIDEVDIADWIFWEKYYISLFRSWGLAKFNISKGGGGDFWTGKDRGQEFRDKLSKSWKPNILSDESKKRKSEKLKSRIKSAEEIEKIRTALLGKKLSVEHKQALSDGHTRKKKCIQYYKNGNFIKQWDSVSEAARFFKFKSISPITRCCNGKRKTAYGYKWEFKTLAT